MTTALIIAGLVGLPALFVLIWMAFFMADKSLEKPRNKLRSAHYQRWEDRL